MQAFPCGLKLKCWRTYTPSPHGLPAPSSRSQPRTDSSSESGCVLSPRNHRVPRAPSPKVGVTHHPGNLKGRLRGHYSSFIAHTGSCVRPNLSRCLGGPSYTRSLQVVASPCWEMVLPDVISACLSLDARAPITAVCEVLIPVSSPTASAFPVLSQVGSSAISHPNDF